MKKIIFKIIQIIIAYIIVAIYGYYNTSEPDNKYSWLISGICVIIVVIIASLVEIIKKKRKKK